MPIEIYSVATVRNIDRIAIDENGIPGYTLMTRAAACALDEASAMFPEAQCWQILCGSGNNAGDGYVLARLAREQGVSVIVTAIADTAKLTGDAATACRDFVAAGGVVHAWTGGLDSAATLIVDALLGSGLDRELGGDYAAAVRACNASTLPMVALDIPTGLHGDSGLVMGCAVRADLTVSFVGLKQGLFLGSGPELRGALRFSALDIPGECFAAQPVALRRTSTQALSELLPRRKRTAHKGDFGHVLVVGGGLGMPGAAILCGEAALRTGAGRVSVATDPSHAATIVNERPELMARGVAAASELTSLLAGCDVLAVGPGLGQSDWANELMQLLQRQDQPCVWDADALNWLAQHPQVATNRVLTPHPGEAATLLGTSNAAVQADRKQAVIELQRQYGGVAVLKGAGTLIKGPGEEIWITTAGNPGMAAPGMGDVLTGIIAALLAQGLDLLAAATAGVEIHAQVGDLAAQSGERGMLASDLLLELRSLVN